MQCNATGERCEAMRSDTIGSVQHTGVAECVGVQIDGSECKSEAKERQDTSGVWESQGESGMVSRDKIGLVDLKTHHARRSWTSRDGNIGENRARSCIFFRPSYETAEMGAAHRC